MKSMRNISCVLVYLVPYLKSTKRVMNALGDFNAAPGSSRFNEICDMLHENNVMFRDTDILPDILLEFCLACFGILFCSVVFGCRYTP